MLASSVLFLWFPLFAVGAHLLEEFVWPGGFARWYRWYRPERAASVTTRFLVVVNAVLVVLALLPPLLGPTPRGLALWLVVAAIGVANAVFHVWATARRATYSPGVVTGVACYVPLFAVGVYALVVPGRVSVGTTVEAVAIGVGFHVWSAWNHSRRATSHSTS